MNASAEDRFLMRRLLIGIAVLVATAAMANNASASTPARVGLPACALGSGTWLVTADSTITLFGGGWGAKNNGLVHAFLNAVTMTASIDGVPITNANSYFGTPVPFSDGGDWLTLWVDPTGITLAHPGDTMTVLFDMSISHQLVDGLTPTHYEPGTLLGGSCTIIAA